MKHKFNFIHILIINEDILGAFGALHVWSEIIHPNIVVKIDKKDVNQPKPVPNVGL